MSIDKTEEQIAKEKAAVDAMKNAKSNMDAALSRIATLEQRLVGVRDDIKRFKGYVPQNAYIYNSSETLHSSMDKTIVEITKTLG